MCSSTLASHPGSGLVNGLSLLLDTESFDSGYSEDGYNGVTAAVTLPSDLSDLEQRGIEYAVGQAVHIGTEYRGRCSYSKVEQGRVRCGVDCAQMRRCSTEQCRVGRGVGCAHMHRCSTEDRDRILESYKVEHALVLCGAGSLQRVELVF